MSQEAIAAEIGVSRRVWQRAEEGHGVHPSSALKIASYFGSATTEFWIVEEETPA